MTSQWVGDIVIDTKQSCDQQPGFYKIQVVGKYVYFTSKTGSSHTTQDNNEVHRQTKTINQEQTQIQAQKQVDTQQ